MVHEEWFKVSEIATLLKVHQNTVREWLKSGVLKGHNFGGRTGWRIRQRDLETFIEGLEGKAAA